MSKIGKDDKTRENYFSFVRWQITSTDRLKARANAIASQSDWFWTKEMIIIIKQNRLTITVSAFLSEKYFLIIDGFTRD